ncbi:MAG: DUF6259 domain-containing protein [Bacteroidota bacterium]|nr:DUF6259 domain-containing protein [Bacteroidota bacterium]
MHSISSGKTKLVFNEEPFLITEIINEETGDKFCINGKQTILLRVPEHISEPAIVFKLQSLVAENSKIKFTLSDEGLKNKADITLSQSEFGICFNMEAISSDSPLWLAEWKLSSLNFDEVIIPALGGQSLTKDMTPDTTLSYKYPFWWNAQFAIGANKNGLLMLHTKDPGAHLKMLRVSKGEKDFSLSIGFEADAPLKSNQIEASWFLCSYKGSWRKAVDSHRKWMEKEFNVLSLKDNPHYPKWAGKINFILEIWGMRKDSPVPHHTFEEMTGRLKEWNNYYSPEKTLVYLPGFAEHGIDSNAPSYSPSPECGGKEKFKELVDTAHEMGYHVMIHTNALAMTFHHPLYPDFSKYQVKDVFNRSQGWAMDIDGDWLTEEYFAYINPGFMQWGDYMEKVLGDLIMGYELDAIFLDQTLLAFNISNGPNFLTGVKDHIKRLQNTFPGILFAGEGIHEQVLSSLCFAQIHGIDSLADVHAMEGKKRWRKVHPVSAYLFGKYTKLTAHLLTKYPAHPLYKLQEKSYKKLGIIPALCLYNNNQKIDIPEVHKMIKRAETLK